MYFFQWISTNVKYLFLYWAIIFCISSSFYLGMITFYLLYKCKYYFQDSHICFDISIFPAFDNVEILIQLIKIIFFLMTSGLWDLVRETICSPDFKGINLYFVLLFVIFIVLDMYGIYLGLWYIGQIHIFPNGYLVISKFFMKKVL